MASYTFGSKPISLKEGSWYNLETGRQIKNPRSEYYFLREPSVAGPLNLVEQFLLENKLPRSVLTGAGIGELPNSLIEHKEVKGDQPQPPSYPPPSASVSSQIQASYREEHPRKLDIGLFPITIKPRAPVQDLEITIQGPSIDKKFSCSLEPSSSCALDKSGSLIFHPNSTDVEDIPESQFDKMCDFSLLGLKTKIRLHRVIDGDTFEVAFFCPIQDLSQPINVRKSGSIEPMVRTFCFTKDVGFFMKMKCRLYGADAAEHDTIQGVIAKVIVRVIAERAKHIFYANFKEFDKYGRPLIEIFFDSARTQSLSQFLINYREPTYGRIAVEYFGDEKSAYMKGLKTISAQEQKEWEEKFLTLFRK